jgi:porin
VFSSEPAVSPGARNGAIPRAVLMVIPIAVLFDGSSAALASNPGSGAAPSAALASVNPSDDPGGDIQLGIPPTTFPPTEGPAGLPPDEVPPSGPLSALGRDLDRNGIRLNGFAYDSFENNVSTGENPGRSGNDISVFLGAAFDLGKIADIPGGTFHIQGGYFFARSRNGTNTGWLVDSSSVLAGLPFINRNQAEYLTNLSYEQKLFADRLDLEIGRLNAKRAFDLPIPGNLLSNDDAVFTMDGGTSPAPYAHWGVRGSYQFTPQWSAGAGAYTVNLAENRTFGTDWRFDQSSGGLLVANGVYQTDFTQRQFPSRFELVPFFNTSPVKDPLDTALGRSVVAFPHDPAALHPGAYGTATRLQQTVWRTRGPAATPRHIDLTGSLSYTPNRYVLAASYEEVGLTLFGLSEDRPFDSISVKVAHLSLNSRAIDFEREARVSVGGPDISTGQNEYRLELNAHVTIARGVAFEPVAEYIINPDTSGAPFSAKVPQDGFILAAMLIVYPNEILGLPGP